MIFDQLRQALAAERAVALATVVAGEQIGAKLLLDPQADPIGSLGNDTLDAQIRSDALVLLDQGRSEMRSYGDAAVLIEVYPPPPHLIIVGAVHTAIPLTAGAKLLGFRVTIVDPRAAFATVERFPAADEIILEWPDEALPRLRLDRSTYVVVLTHDPKLDDPAVRVALERGVRYVGAIGSTKTQAKRKQALRDEGVPDDLLSQIYGPVGLALGSKTPAEIAVSILAQIVGVRRGVVLPPAPSA